MTVKEFIQKSDISSIDFEICEEETKALLYEKDCKSLKDLIAILDCEINQFYGSQSCFRLYVKTKK